MNDRQFIEAHTNLHTKACSKVLQKCFKSAANASKLACASSVLTKYGQQHIAYKYSHKSMFASSVLLTQASLPVPVLF
jgi:hypothetical protein